MIVNCDSTQNPNIDNLLVIATQGSTSTTVNPLQIRLYTAIRVNDVNGGL